jgi:hypothetical protein
VAFKGVLLDYVLRVSETHSMRCILNRILIGERMSAGNLTELKFNVNNNNNNNNNINLLLS